MCTAPQTAHKSEDLAMQSHGVLYQSWLSQHNRTLSLSGCHTWPPVTYCHIITFLEDSSYLNSSALKPILSSFVLHVPCNERGKADLCLQVLLLYNMKEWKKDCWILFTILWMSLFIFGILDLIEKRWKTSFTLTLSSFLERYSQLNPGGTEDNLDLKCKRKLLLSPCEILRLIY